MEKKYTIVIEVEAEAETHEEAAKKALETIKNLEETDLVDVYVCEGSFCIEDLIEGK